MERQGRDRQIDYIEFGVSDIPRAKDFYGRAFGWTFTDYGPDYCEFSDGRLSGGFSANGPVRPRGGALVILYANDLAGTLNRIEESGGIIVKSIYSFPGGSRFHFLDPDGHELAVWTESRGSQVAEPGNIA